MAFDISTKANLVFKKILGKIHTSNDRDPANEPESSGFLISAQKVWADALHRTDPTHVSMTNIVATGDGVASRIKLDLLPVSGTNSTGKYSSYYAAIPNPVPASLVGKVNPKTGTAFAAGDRVGNLIADSFGFAYIAKPFCNNVEVPPSDASDWFVDYESGVLTQETDVIGNMKDYTLANSRLEAYVYTGSLVSDKLVQLGGGYTYTFYDYQTIGSGIVGDINGVNTQFTLTYTPDANSQLVFLNGMLQMPGASNDYTISGNTITFLTAPTEDDSLVVSYRVRNS